MEKLWPAGESELARLIRASDWNTTPLGAIEHWPERLKGLVDLILASQQPMLIAVGPGLAMIYNDAYTGFLANKHPATLGAPFRDVFAEIGSATDPLLARVQAGRQEILLDQHFAMPWRTHAPEGWFTATLTPTLDASGEVSGFIAVITETTEAVRVQRRAEQSDERLRLLLSELQHRVRNVLATVRSIVRRTMQSSETVEDLSMHLEGRLAAMARTQMILSRSPGTGVDLETIMREELLAQASVEKQVSIEGEPVDLSPKAAEVISLALHELTTNSIKYGALHSPAGRITIVWRTFDRDGETWLRLAWVESGVKIVAPAPRREGFGLELITGRVPYELSGMGTLDLKPGGLHATIEFPLRPGPSVLEA